MSFKYRAIVSAILLLITLASLAAYAGQAKASEDLPHITGAALVSTLITLGSPTTTQVGVSPDHNFVYIVGKDVIPRANVADRGKYGSNVQLNSRIYIFDVRDPQHPRSSGAIKLSDFGADFGVWVDDKLCFHVATTDHDPMELDIASGLFVRSNDQLVVLDVTQPLHPTLKRFSGEYTPSINNIPAECTRLHVRPAWVESAPYDNIDGEQAFVNDRFGNQELVNRGSALEIWEQAPGLLPVRRAAVRELTGGDPLDNRLLHMTGFIVLDFLYRSRTMNELVKTAAIFKYEKPPFGWTHLLWAHRELLGSYFAGQPEALNDTLASELADAGAGVLLTQEIPPERRQSQIRILNDWGFWASKGSHPSTAIPILQKVLSLDPDRLVAWKNLADAAESALAEAGSAADKVRLAQIKQEASNKIAALKAK